MTQLNTRTLYDGPKKPPQYQEGQTVLATLFDGHVKDRRGIVLGCAVNTDGEVVYLVEMLDPPQEGDDYGRQEGTAQVGRARRCIPHPRTTASVNFNQRRKEWYADGEEVECEEEADKA
jgi:hypothetical protein